MLPDRELLFRLAGAARPRMIDFCRRLIQTPSPSGQEGALAALIQTEMRLLDYDEVTVDEAGNVIGVLSGVGDGATVQFNTHMDHVDPGDPKLWPYPPYEGVVAEGAIWGRGASDVKGAIATQVYSVAALKQAGLPLHGHVEVTAVVQEEIGGIGTRFLARHRRPDVAVIGEATSNRLALAHRGSTNIIARFVGKSVHSSRPADGINPHYSAAAFLRSLRDIPMGHDELLGASTIAPTLFQSDQTSANVTPGRVDLLLNWRDVPSDDLEVLLDRLRQLQLQALEPGCRGEMFIPPRHVQTYTGYVDVEPYRFPPLITPADDPVVKTALGVLERALGRPVPTVVWAFATDGGHLAQAGVPCIGFGPMVDTYAHTVDDRIDIAMMEEGFVGYMALALGLSRLPSAHMW